MMQNESGQAAVTDALYFILIVTFLSVFLFGFANSYGNNVSEEISAQNSTSFATNSLKTILYSSTPRSADDPLTDPDTEIDYLLAIIKEDYSDDEQIDERERLVLGKTISDVLRPVQDTLDYAFYITIPPLNGQSPKFVFLYLHTTNFTRTGFNSAFNPTSDELARYFNYSSVADDVSTPKDESHTNYFCAVSGADYDTLSRQLQRLLVNVGPTSQSTASIKLVKENNTGFQDFKAQVDLVLWDATWLGLTDGRSSELFEASEWNCIDSSVSIAAAP